MAGAKKRGIDPQSSAEVGKGGNQFDGQETYDVIVTIAGTPTAVAADYASLVTSAQALATCRQVDWQKR